MDVSFVPLMVGMAQIRVEGGRPHANLERAIDAIDQAAASNCDVIVLPECLDLGWTDHSSQWLAEPVPGPRTEVLQRAARSHGIVVVAGLTERAGESIFNTAIVCDRDGSLVGIHRKVREIEEARGIYDTGHQATVLEASIGRVGVLICADNLTTDLIDEAAFAGAQMILSPSSWAVSPDHDEDAQPYGQEWLAPYGTAATAHGLPIVGVSNVGQIRSGPWRGRLCIGKSLAIDSNGKVKAVGPYGVNAETLIVVELAVPVQSFGAFGDEAASAAQG